MARFVAATAIGGVLVYFGVALFQRVAPYRFVRAYWKVINPIFRVFAGRVPGYVLLETIGRKSGRRHQVPVAGKLNKNVVWIVVGHASRSAFLRNVRANPQVRVRVNRRWREGRAEVVGGDDARRRAWRTNPANAGFLRVASSDLATLRVELD